MTSKIEDAYVIGSQNFSDWSQGYDSNGYLKVLPHPNLKVPFKDPFQDWQAGRPGNYISSWGPTKDLTATLKMQDINQVKIDGFGVLKSGDGVIPWLNNKATPYEQLRGYNGTIPGPFLITEPGDTLKIQLDNSLTDGQSSNLHTHGTHVSPMGYGDNVLHAVTPGETWPVSIQIPDDHYTGLDWYHPHLHGLTNEQVASGLGGQLLILPPYNIPDLNKFNPQTSNLHFMALNTFGIQQIDRVGKPNDPLNQNPSTPVPAGTPLKVDRVQGDQPVYTLSDAPFVGYSAKPLLYDPTQPTGNPAQQLSEYGGGALVEPVENAIYTVNGQYNPTLDIGTGAWNVFSFTNMSVNTFHLITLVKKVGDQLIPQSMDVVALDGDISGTVSSKITTVDTLPVLSSGQRVAFQKWFDEPGTYYLLSNATEELLGDKTPSLIKGQKGFNDGHLIWGPQVLSTIEVTGASTPVGAPPAPYDTTVQQSQKVDNLIASAANGKVDRERQFVWSANIGEALVTGKSPDDTKAASFEGTYRINGNYFATNFTDDMVPLAMPMLGTTEVWNMINTSGSLSTNLPPGVPNIPLLEWHPFHIHQNDFTVLSINGIATKDIKNGYLSGVLQDTIALPPTYDPSKPPTVDNPYGVPMVGGKPSETKVLMEFTDFPGSFVNHCHILFHEDAGMMAPVRIILNTNDMWLGGSSQSDTVGQLTLRRASNLNQYVTLLPYGTSFNGVVKTAIADINYKQKSPTDQNVTDNVTDVAVIQSSPVDGKLSVKVFDGQALAQKQDAGQQVIDGADGSNVLAQFSPFRQGIPLTQATTTAIATGDIDGDGFSDIVVGISGDRSPQLEIYSGKDYHLMARLTPFASNPSFQGPISIAAGDANGDNFDDILIGGNGAVEAYSGMDISGKGSLNGKVTAANTSLLPEQLHPYGTSYTGGINVTSGYILQRPDTPNGAATQTYHANISTLATDLPQGQQTVKVFTLTGGHKMTMDGGGHQSDMTMDSAAQDTAMTTSSSGLPSNVRLDAQFTPSTKLTELYGTFADLPGQPRGEPVLYAKTASGSDEIIHLGSLNVATENVLSNAISGRFAALSTDPGNSLINTSAPDLLNNSLLTAGYF